MLFTTAIQSLTSGVNTLIRTPTEVSIPTTFLLVFILEDLEIKSDSVEFIDSILKPQLDLKKLSTLSASTMPARSTRSNKVFKPVTASTNIYPNVPVSSFDSMRFVSAYAAMNH
ncbi:unnamed protein product [Ambrosiozyma monospora]|uniref:Unnamed protein product n=1 Tax=Ambrosiozyma monospora TaxID=43982 RepID=A0ACB5SZ70_AMBMO|nr:unnamed protein product [Ambrosiozyma monospora]